MLSEVSQLKKEKTLYDSTNKRYPEKLNLQTQKAELLVAKGWGEEMGDYCLISESSSYSVMSDSL